MLFKIYICLLFSINITLAQFDESSLYQPKKNDIVNTISDDAYNSVNTIFQLIQSPLNFDNNDLILAGFVVAMTGASFSIDNKVRNDIINRNSRTLDNITYYGEKFGRPIYATILSGLLYSTGLITDNSYMKETGQILAEAMICTGIFTQLLKETLGRARPFTGESYRDISFLEFEFSNNENSLPSGHTSIAFTVATVLSRRFDNIYASVGLYSLASLTAYQRMYSDAHWFSDVLLGAVLGTVIGSKIVRLHEKEDHVNSDFDMNIFPTISPNSYGVGLSLQF